MTEPAVSSSAIDYLQPQDVAFWRWNFEESTIEWLDGKTICFTSEIEQIVSVFGESGLPYFDLVLLVVATLRDNWNPYRTDSKQDAVLLKYLEYFLKDEQDQLKCIAGLDRINRLTSSLRHSLDSKKQLVFHFLKNAVRCCNKRVLQDVRCKLSNKYEWDTESHPTNLRHERQSEIADGLKHLIQVTLAVDEDRIRLLLETGAEQLVEPADDDIVVCPRTEALELIDDLLGDMEFLGIGRLARDLLGVLYRTPKALHNNDSAVGGTSDIANRGSIDRLLLSELANDSDALAIRIAMNEAMYLRREPPPKSPQTGRCILIDSGLRTWGIARLFSTSVALALVASAERLSPVRVWRARCEELIPTFLIDRSGLRNHMAALEVDLHLGEALPAFYQNSLQVDPDAEMYLVTTRDSWNDLVFQKALRLAKFNSLTAVVIDKQGGLELIAVSLAGSVSLKNASVTLDKIGGSIERPNSTAKSNQEFDASLLPKIFSTDPFPIALGARARSLIALDKNVVIGETSDGRLMLWSDLKLGGLQVSEGLKKKRLIWGAIDTDSAMIAIVLKDVVTKKFHLLNVEPVSGRVHSQFQLLDLAGPDYEFYVESNALIAICRTEALAISLFDGQLICQSALKPRRAGRLSVFEDLNGNWCGLDFNGDQFTEHVVVSSSQIHEGDVVLVTQTRSRTGYVIFKKSGTCYNTAEEFLSEAIVVEKGCFLTQVFTSIGDGRWIQLCCKDPKNSTMFWLRLCMTDYGRIEGITDLPGNSINSKFQSPVTPLTLPYRHRFTKVGLLDGFLTLAKGRSLLSLQCEKYGLCWRSYQQSALQSIDEFVDFETLSAESTGRAYRIDHAAVAGYEFFLDSRGILHIRNNQAGDPELSIVIKEGGVASGWTSNGEWFGDSVHCGIHNPTKFSDLKLGSLSLLVGDNSQYRNMS